MAFWKYAGRSALVLGGVLAAVGVWKREELTRLGAVTSLFSQEKIVHNFSHMKDAFVSVPIAPTGQVRPLPQGAPMAMPEEWETWLSDRTITAAVVLRDGQIVHESYHQGTAQGDQRISWSVAKSYLSALFGIIMAQGKIDNLDDPVTKYLPELADSAYNGVKLRHILQMSSGVEFDEDYLDFWSDINKMGRILALGGSMDDFTAGQDRPLSNRAHNGSMYPPIPMCLAWCCAGSPGNLWRI